MTEITAQRVKELRERTGAGMMDCKRALTETSGDLEAAIDWLRKKGLSAAAKKSGRIAAEGLIGLCLENNRGALVEVNAETDFVSRNETFQAFVRTVAGLAFDVEGRVEDLGQRPHPGGTATVQETLTELIATIGENMMLRRAAVLSVGEGVVAAYLHNVQAEGLARIGVLVAAETPKPSDAAREVVRKVAMHIAAANPQALSRDDVDPTLVERERSVLVEQARASGKPEAIIGKMVEGRLSKFYEEVCLLEQTYVIDGESKVKAVIEAAAKDLGAPITVTGFVRFALGEGIDKGTKDFAQEVASALA
jgi:elongation factor Ts